MDTDSAPLTIALVIGSTRGGRFGPTVARWVARQAASRPDMHIDLMDLTETPLPLEMPAQGTVPPPEVTEALGAVTPRLAAADGFVLVTPEYNHSYPASLKNLIDWHFTQWQAKPVAFVSYGGLSGGLRAVEHLRPVLAELHATTVRDTVSFHNAWDRFEGDGAPKDPDGPTAAAKAMLDQLAWWARALKEARTAHPYNV